MNRWMGLLAAALLWSGGVQAGAHRYAATVDGLACPFCAYGVEKKLSALDGVKKVEIDIERGVVLITVEENRALTEDAVRAAIAEAGFTLRRLEPARDAGGSG